MGTGGDRDCRSVEAPRKAFPGTRPEGTSIVHKGSRRHIAAGHAREREVCVCGGGGVKAWPCELLQLVNASFSQV